MRNLKKDRRGAKRKTPDNAVMKLIYDNGLSTYYFKKENIMNPGVIYYSSKRDVRHLALSFFMKLGKGLHMKWYVVIEKLLKLQKRYPPQIPIKYDKKK